MTHRGSAWSAGRASVDRGRSMPQLFQTPFGRTSTASEVIDGVDLSGQRAIVTGAGSGIGIETARALASAGAEVVLAVRRPEAAEQIAAGIVGSTGHAQVPVRALDTG